MSTLREAVLAEARTWLRTPFHSGQRVKGVGVDCGQILLAVYEKVGIIEHYETEFYPADYHLHQSKEWYLGLMERFAKRVEVPQPADIALWKFGRVYSHGGIVVEWPHIIHAHFPSRMVLEDNADRHQLKLSMRPVIFFDAIGDR